MGLQLHFRTANCLLATYENGLPLANIDLMGDDTAVRFIVSDIFKSLISIAVVMIRNKKKTSTSASKI